MNKDIKLKDFTWINQPKKMELTESELNIKPATNTDLWQRTYYGFQNDNAPGLLRDIKGDFTFTVKTAFDAKNKFDQCGVLLYQNSENWVKVSVEYENESIARLGSVVTNLGYSDWATTDISASLTEMWYRFSRSGQDFYAEFSTDGENFKQMRIIHMHQKIDIAKLGVYACCPIKEGYKANFSNFKLEDCKWEKH
jgi:regulation of enolase protein 1 (concanavalin A-like superfamily)